MSKYVRSVLKDNQFKCNLKFKFEDVDTAEVEALIDTGCMYSHISADLIYIFLSDEERKNTKKKYMHSRNVFLCTGIESLNTNINCDLTDVDNPYINIIQNCYNLDVAGVQLGNKRLAISYDTTQVALLGMQFFKDWDIHIGKNKYGETIFIGCPNNLLNQEYYLALEKEFDLSTQINSSIINNYNNK